MRAKFDVTQTTDNVPVDKVSHGKYTRPGLELTNIPKFQIDVINPGGVEMFRLGSGKEVSIKRNGRLEFVGIVETPTGIEGEGPTSVSVEGVHKGYHRMRAAQCTSYDFDEDGNPATDRDGVTVNPWETFILRRDDGTVDEYGNTKALDGITFDQYVHHLVGSKFVYQHQFEDNSHLLASQASARGSGSNFLTVYRDGKTGDRTPSLQRYRDGSGFKAGTFVESIPLYNNDRNVSRMGTIQTAQVLIIGNRVSKISNTVLGQALGGCSGIDSDVSGHTRDLGNTGSPTNRNAATLTKFNLGRNLDGVNDAYFSSDQTFNTATSLTYFYAGIVDVLPTGSNKFYLGGWFDSLTTISPWQLYVDSTGAIVYYHSNGTTTQTFSTSAGLITAGAEFTVYVRRDHVTGGLQIRVNNGTYFNTNYDPLVNPPAKTVTGLFTIGTDDFVNAGHYFGDGGVWEARFWSKSVNIDTLQKIGTNASTDYQALLEGTEEAAWFMCTETNPGTATTFTGQDPTLQVCRNAVDATRTYTAVTLARTSNYLQSGLEAWTGTITFSGSEVNKNALGYKLTLPGSGADLSSTKVYYIKFICDTTPDTGLTVGTIQTYASPFTFNGEENWIATDMQGFNRLEAAEKLRKLTEADTTLSPSPFWDMWIDDALTFNFKQRRGAAVSKTYSFAAGNLKKIRHEFYGGELAFQTIAYGAGSGSAQTRIVSKQEFSQGGLYDSDRDPAGTVRRYGDLPRILSFVDSNEVSAVALLRKGRASHRLHRDPIENVIVEVNNETIPFFDVGDSPTFQNVRTRTKGSLRVINLGREWSGDDQEKVSVEIGQRYSDLLADINSNQKQTKIISLRAQPQDNVTGLSGDGTILTATVYGVWPFAIQDGRTVERVFLDISTLPWQIDARGGVTQPAATSTTVSHTHPSVDISVGLQGVSSGNLGRPPTSVGLAQSLTVTSSTSAWTDFGTTFTPAVSSSIPLDYVEVLTLCYNDYEALQKLNASFRLVRTNGANSGDIIALSVVTSEFSFTTPGGGFADQNTVSLLHRVTLNTQAVNLIVLPTDTFKLQIQTTGHAGTTFTDDFYSFITLFYQHAHDVSVGAGGAHNHVIAAHSHPILYGIWQFDGDGGDSTGNPVYGTGIKLAIDPPTVNAVGIPTNYDNERMPLKFGTKDAPQNILIDITGYLATDSSGAIKSGVHKVYFLAEAGDPSGAYSNLQGLAKVAVTPVLQFRKGGE